MNKIVKKFVPLAALAAFTGILAGQEPVALPQPGQPAQQSQQGQAATQPGQPAGPSQEEIADLQKLAQPPQTVEQLDAQIAAADAFVAKFPNSDYKSFVYSVAAQANQMKGNSTRAVFYYEKALEADPKDYTAMLMIAAETAQATREFDLDKDQKLSRASKLVDDAMKLIPDAPKPNPQLTDEQWAGFKKDDMARGYEALGLIAMAKKDHPEAAKQFQASIDAAATQQPATFIRLGAALNESKRYDEAIAVLDKAIAIPGLPEQIKSIAESERKRTDQLKAAGK